MFKFKFFLIPILLFLAIYQTSSLWFEDFYTTNIKNIISNKYTDFNISKSMQYTVESIIINTGNNKFLKQYNNFYKSEYKRILDQAISESVYKGNFYYEKVFDTQQLINNKSIIFNYSYILTLNDLQNIFKLKAKYIPKNIKFNKIGIIPTKNKSGVIKIAFFNSFDKDAYIFKLKKAPLNENIYSTLENFSNFEDKMFYNISTEKSNINIFNENQFIPIAKAKEGSINKIKAINPLEQEGGILLSGIERHINVFFDNIAIKWNSTIDDIYTYKNNDTVVKYYPNNVLEYVNYKTVLSNNLSPYKLALNFLQKDINIKNEYYLKDFSYSKDGITFYFDYKINNFPIILSDQFKQKTNMNSMIEVTVFENKVYKYKKVVLDFFIEDDYNSWNVSFFDIIKNFTKEQIKQISDINLVYLYDNFKNNMELSWQIKLKDTFYIKGIEDSDKLWTGN